MQKTIKMTQKGKLSGNGQVNRIFMNYKKKLNPGVVLTLSWGYIHVYDLYSQINLGSQVSVYRTIGPLVYFLNSNLIDILI